MHRWSAFNSLTVWQMLRLSHRMHMGFPCLRGGGACSHKKVSVPDKNCASHRRVFVTGGAQRAHARVHPSASPVYLVVVPHLMHMWYASFM